MKKKTRSKPLSNSHHIKMHNYNYIGRDFIRALRTTVEKDGIEEYNAAQEFLSKDINQLRKLYPKYLKNTIRMPKNQSKLCKELQDEFEKDENAEQDTQKD